MFPKGSVIKRPLEGFLSYLFNFEHLGIFIGDDKVIHFTGIQKKERKSTIEIDSLNKFSSGFKVCAHRKPISTQHAKKIVEKAYEIYRNKNNVYNNQYSFIFRNCEDFVKYCYEVEY